MAHRIRHGSWLAAGWVALFVLISFGMPETGAPQKHSIVANWGDPTSPPLYDRGMLIFHHLSQTAPQQFSIFTEEGKLLHSRLRIDLPGAGPTWPISLAAMPGGQGFVAGCLTLPAAGKFSTYLVWLDKTGAVQRQARISPIQPRMIHVAEDGTVWVMGADPRDDSPQSEHPVLHRFSPQGERLSSAIARNVLAPDAGALVYSLHQGRSVLTSTPARVYFYQAASRMLFELDHVGRLLHSWSVALPAGAPSPGLRERRAGILGMAATASGEIYAYLYGGDNPGLHRFARDQVAWIPIHPPGRLPGEPISLLGARGDELIVQWKAGSREISLGVWRPADQRAGGAIVGNPQ